MRVSLHRSAAAINGTRGGFALRGRPSFVSNPRSSVQGSSGRIGAVRRFTRLQIPFKSPAVVKKPQGVLGTTDYRLFFESEDGKAISPWHDIPLVSGTSLEGTIIHNFVCEMQRVSNAKMEMAVSEEYNPIKQDVLDGQPRIINYSCIGWNYGFLPQTWESPTVKDPITGLEGDKDPLDVVDVGVFMAKQGDVYQVKVFGAIGVIDEGETDWKILAVNTLDPKASKINSPADLEVQKPGLLTAIKEFYTYYKSADGKPKNIVYGQKPIGMNEALEVINHGHEQWKLLRESKPEGVWTS